MKARTLNSYKNTPVEITTIKAVNPLDKTKQKTVYMAKRGPSMQIEFKNQQ